MDANCEYRGNTSTTNDQEQVPVRSISTDTTKDLGIGLDFEMTET